MMNAYDAFRWVHDPDANHSERFDDIAAWFYSETGFIRPGKSQPPEMSHTDEERQAAWAEWLTEKQRAFRDFVWTFWLNEDEDRRTEEHEPACGCGDCRYTEEEARRKHERAHSAWRLG